MNSSIERLLGLRVSDVMQTNVIQLKAYSTMAEAADTLFKYEISGAPVVDEADRCIGILSALDFVRRERDQAKGGAFERAQSDTGARPMLNVGGFENERVERHMTPMVHSVASKATLMETARLMCAVHVHRIPVLDGSDRPVGMVSSLDLVAAMVHAIEE